MGFADISDNAVEQGHYRVITSPSQVRPTTQAQPTRQQQAPPQAPVPAAPGQMPENLNFPKDPEIEKITQQEHHGSRARLFVLDSVERDGQIKPGEVDKEQEEFLRNTSMVD